MNSGEDVTAVSLEEPDYFRRAEPQRSRHKDMHVILVSFQSRERDAMARATLR